MFVMGGLVGDGRSRTGALLIVMVCHDGQWSSRSGLRVEDTQRLKIESGEVQGPAFSRTRRTPQAQCERTPAGEGSAGQVPNCVKSSMLTIDDVLGPEPIRESSHCGEELERHDFESGDECTGR